MDGLFNISIKIFPTLEKFIRTEKIGGVRSYQFKEKSFF